MTQDSTALDAAMAAEAHKPTNTLFDYLPVASAIGQRYPLTRAAFPQYAPESRGILRTNLQKNVQSVRRK